MKSDLTINPVPESSINLAMLYSLVWRRSWVIVLFLLVTVGAALTYVTLATPIYESNAVLEVQKTEQPLYTPGDQTAKNDGLPNDNVEVQTIEQALQLDSLYDKVVVAPAVVADKDFIPGLMFSPDAKPTTHDIAMRLKKFTTIKLLHGTRLINISVDHPNAATAQLLAATLVNTFIAQNGRSQTDTTKVAMAFLQKETEHTRAEMQEAQNALQVYGEALLLRDQIVDQQKVVVDLSQRYRAKHPRLIQARSELAQLEERLDENITNVVANSPAEAAYWNGSFKDLATATPEERVETELKQVEARTSVLQREGDTQSALFDNVLKQMREAAIGKENAPVEVQLAQEADLPEGPAKPRKTLILALAAAVGIALGFFTVFAFHSLDSTLKTVPEIEQLFKLPVLGSMPQVRETNSKKATAQPGPKKGPIGPVMMFHKNVVLLSDPDSSAAENFRSLRAAVDLLGKAKDHRVVLFTSALTDEGKTFTSCNYAVSLAQQGLRTLLIDADLRCPAVHERFEITGKTMGLIEHVSLGVPWEEVIQRNVVENLDILLPGVKSPNPAEFLSGDGLKDVIRMAMQKYDRVVLDTPPINAVSDTLLIAPNAQATCLVIRAKRTPRGAVERALSLLKMANVIPVGIVFNYIPTGWKSPYSMPKYYYADNRYGQAYAKASKG